MLPKTMVGTASPLTGERWCLGAGVLSIVCHCSCWCLVAAYCFVQAACAVRDHHTGCPLAAGTHRAAGERHHAGAQAAGPAAPSLGGANSSWRLCCRAHCGGLHRTRLLPRGRTLKTAWHLPAACYHTMSTCGPCEKHGAWCRTRQWWRPRCCRCSSGWLRCCSSAAWRRRGLAAPWRSRC